MTVYDIMLKMIKGGKKKRKLKVQKLKVNTD